MWKQKIVRKAGIVLNYVHPEEEHPSGTTGQLLRREYSVNAQTFTERSFQKSQIISQSKSKPLTRYIMGFVMLVRFQSFLHICRISFFK